MSEDLIKRSDAIEPAYQLRHKPNDEEWGDWLKSFNAIPSADSPQEWIPCRERLPELTIHENEPFIGEWDNSEPVLIYHKDNKYEYPYLIAQYTNGFENNEVGWTEMEDANDVIDVVAWMPLPKPWKGADDE